ncbi:hypothetical protein COI42_26715 [Priestia aryabhattai]|nr:hypothetical protein COI42_26715 [Priestia aryabhattai]
MGGLCCDYDLKGETFINKNRSFLLVAVVINIAIWIFVQEQVTRLNSLFYPLINRSYVSK